MAYNGRRGLYETGARFSLAGDPDWNQLLSQAITDVTQVIRPNTPTAVPVYTPASTAAGSLFNNPAALLGVGALVYLLVKRAR